MSEQQRTGFDPGDALAVIATSAVGAAVAGLLVESASDRWLLPGLAGLAVGLAVVLLAPKQAPLVSASPLHGAAMPPSLLPPTQSRAAPPLISANRSAATAAAATTLAPPVPPTGSAASPVVDPDATSVRPKRAKAPVRTGQFSVRTMTMPKVGGKDEENEDAFAVSVDGSRIAVADGASSAYASRHWARLLVDTYTTFGADLASPASRQSFVASCASQWESSMAAVAGGSWWDNEARSRGSFAAFVGAQLSADGSVTVDAVGDCCSFVLDPNAQLLHSFPLEQPAQFDSTPSLLATAAPGEGEWLVDRGRLAAGHTMVLASDAVSAWLLGDPTERFPWLLATNDIECKRAFVQQRHDGGMVNDDVTVVSITSTGRQLR